MWGKLCFLGLWKSLSLKSLGSLNKHEEPHWALISINTMKDKNPPSIIFFHILQSDKPIIWCMEFMWWSAWWPRCLWLPVMSMVMMSFWQLSLSQPQTKVIVDGYIYVKKSFSTLIFSSYLCHFLCAVSALDLSILWGGMILNALQTTYVNCRGWSLKRNLLLYLSHARFFLWP